MYSPMYVFDRSATTIHYHQFRFVQVCVEGICACLYMQIINKSNDMDEWVCPWRRGLHGLNRFKPNYTNKRNLSMSQFTI